MSDLDSVLHSGQPVPMKPIWSLGMLSFTPSQARQSLANQLLILKTLAHMPPGVSLTWRLKSSRAPDESTVFASLALICSIGDSSAVPDESLAELENIASVALAAGWSLSRQTTPSVQPRPRFTRLLLPPLQTTTLPVKPDWAVLVDLIRHRGTALTIDVTCHSTGETIGGHSDGAVATSDASAFDFDLGVSFLDNLRADEPCLGVELTLSVGSDRALDPALLQLIGTSVLGLPIRAVTSTKAALDSKMIYAPAIALRAWHAPYAPLQGRGLQSVAHKIAASHDLSQSNGIVIGTTRIEGPDWDRPASVRIPAEERLRHIYIVGKTGAGKTNLMKQIAAQDILDGRGVAVITPHADLIEYLLDAAGDRVDDIILLDFGDPTHLPAINPLTLDTSSNTEYSATVSRLVELFARRTFNQFTGPVFSDSVRLAFETVAVLAPEAGSFPTISAGVEIVKSDKLQRWASRIVKQRRPDLAEDWERVFNMRGSEAAETSRWITAKFNDFGAHSALRSITTQVHASPLSIRNIYRDNKVLLVRIPDTHMPSSAASLMGGFIFNRLFEEAQLAGITPRSPFYIHVDEFQRFVSSDLEELVAEARKFHVGLTFAHQNLMQLEAFSAYEGTTNPRLADAIFANVGTLVAMKTSGRDVQRFAAELSLSEAEVRSVNRGHAIVRTGHNGEDVTCSVAIPLASIRERRGLRRSVRSRMIKQGYWYSRAEQDVHAEDLLMKLRRTASAKPAGDATENSADNAPTTSGAASPNDTFFDSWLAKKAERIPTDAAPAQRRRPKSPKNDSLHATDIAARDSA
jgi:hypothetical protein